MTDSKSSSPKKAETPAPATKDKKAITGSPPRGRGKMYWKFAAIEGWKANKPEPAADISQKKK